MLSRLCLLVLLLLPQVQSRKSITRVNAGAQLPEADKNPSIPGAKHNPPIALPGASHDDAVEDKAAMPNADSGDADALQETKNDGAKGVRVHTKMSVVSSNVDAAADDAVVNVQDNAINAADNNVVPGLASASKPKNSMPAEKPESPAEPETMKGKPIPPAVNAKDADEVQPIQSHISIDIDNVENDSQLSKSNRILSTSLRPVISTKVNITTTTSIPPQPSTPTVKEEKTMEVKTSEPEVMQTDPPVKEDPEPKIDSSADVNVPRPPSYSNGDVRIVEPKSSHFVTYILTVGILIGVAYVALHNRQKIIGLIVEGRISQPRRSTVGYRRVRTEA